MSISTRSLIASLLLATLVNSVTVAGSNSDTTLSVEEKNRLKELIDSNSRPTKLKVRNKYRNPFETLSFFNVKSDQTVVEIWPGGQGGWYRSILQPYLASHGHYIPVRSNSAFPAPLDDFDDGSADHVLVFRAHGFMIYQHPAQTYFHAIFNMLKPGGSFGIVDHRGNESIAQDPEGKNGYVNQSHVIKLATQAGFDLVASSEINANPKDTKDYPNGLYSLPPSLKGSTFNAELRRKVLEIGESDRMTLKFIKPSN